MPDDRVSAYLAEVRKRSEQLLGPSAGALPIANDAVHALMKSAGDVPFLLAALEAVLDVHYQSLRPAPSGPDRDKHWCVGCYRDIDHHILYTPWPCPTHRAISAKLLGKADHG